MFLFLPKVSSPVVRFHVTLDGLILGASLIPSLKAEYKMDGISGRGITGADANFSVQLKTHRLSFNTKDKNILAGLLVRRNNVS